MVYYKPALNQNNKEPAWDEKQFYASHLRKFILRGASIQHALYVYGEGRRTEDL